ncbi:hypothetical protein [Nonomuraea sp. NPDC049400]|uniref:hypothetical protein n=1 Tax=Nonomuraea sp. NPDC049400 TaxID=3364352 RepID=UPI0037A8134A
MADYDLPEDLLQLKRDFLENEARLPGLEGEEWQAAFKRSQDLALALHNHPWWASVDNRYQADVALLRAAKGEG